MKSYYRLMLGRKSTHAAECFAGGFIGTDMGVYEDLTGKLPEDFRTFNQDFSPVYLASHPEKTKIGAGLACSALWTVSKGIQNGDIVLCPDGTGTYRLGEVTGDYNYQPNGVLMHRRPVRWLEQSIERADMSEALRNSSGSVGTVCELTKYRAELETLMTGVLRIAPLLIEAAVEDPAAFAMESHLEDFLVKNWAQTELGKDYEIYQEEDEIVGQQYAAGRDKIDILAVSKDKKKLLVVELKRGRASDVVVGQVLRYMGYVQSQLVAPGQNVHGVIIALEDDQRIRFALTMVPNVEFYRYRIDFKLVKA